MEQIVCDMDDRLDHEEHKGDFKDGSKGRIAGSAVGIIHAPVGHADDGDEAENDQHAGCDLKRETGEAKHPEERAVNGDEKDADDPNHTGTEIDDAPAS